MKEEEIKKRIRKLLVKDRYQHTLNVHRIAVGIAEKLNCNELDVQRVSIAALLHDAAKCFSNDKSLKIIKRDSPLFLRKRGTVPLFLLIPKIWHSRVSAIIAKKDFGIKDKIILNAIKNHTTGSANMGLVDKIIYVADIIDVDKNIKGIDKVKKAISKSIDLAMMEAMRLKMFYLVKNSKCIHSDTIDAWNSILLRIK